MQRLIITLLNQYDQNPKILTEWAIPTGLNKEDLETRLMIECGELECYITNPLIMQKAIGAWSRGRIPEWQRIADLRDLEYNPIWNVDGETVHTGSHATESEDSTTGGRRYGRERTENEEIQRDLETAESGSKTTSGDRTAETSGRTSTTKTEAETTGVETSGTETGSTSGTANKSGSGSESDSNETLNKLAADNAEGWSNDTITTYSGSKTTGEESEETTTGSSSKTTSGTSDTERSLTGSGSETKTGSETEHTAGAETERKTGTESETIGRNLAENINDTESTDTTGEAKTSGTETWTEKRTGNIGVTMTQQMLQAELDFWASYDICGMLIKEFQKEFLLEVY